MSVKNIEIARALGLSKATVSLALAGKPGVNEKTRERILACRDELEKEKKEGAPAPLRTILALVVNHGKNALYDPEMDLFSGVLSAMEQECTKRNYLFHLAYLNASENMQETILAECNQEMVHGVIVLGTEINRNDLAFFQRITKPLVVYDSNLLGDSYSSICIDNARAVRLACEYLWNKGCRRIRYAATSKDIYNFSARRDAYIFYMVEHGSPVEKKDLMPLGKSIAEITESLREFLTLRWDRKEALILENYQVAIAALAAARKTGIKIPDELKVVGIDKLPAYLPGESSLPQVVVHHEERAVLAVDLLAVEIERKASSMKSRVLSIPYLRG